MADMIHANKNENSPAAEDRAFVEPKERTKKEHTSGYSPTSILIHILFRKLVLSI